MNTVAVKGDNENTKATEGKLSICQSSRKVATLKAGGPQKSFIAIAWPVGFTPWAPGYLSYY